MRQFFFTFCIFFSIWSVFPESNPESLRILKIHSGESRYNLRPHLETRGDGLVDDWHYLDESPTESDLYTFPKTKDLWIRIQLEVDPSELRKFLFLLETGSHSDQIDFFIVDSLSGKTLYHACRGKKSRPDCWGDFSVNFSHLAGTTRKISLLTHIQAYRSIDFYLKLTEIQEFNAIRALQKYNSDLFPGMSILILILGIGFLVVYRKGYYVYFYLFLVFNLLSIYVLLGEFYEYLYDQDFLWTPETKVGLSNLGSVFSMLWVRSFVGSKNILGKFDRFLIVAIGLLFLSTLIYLITNSYLLYFFMNLPILALVLVFLLTLIVKAYRLKIKSFQYISVIWIIKLIWVIYIYMYKLDILPYSLFTFLDYQVFFVPEAIFGFWAIRQREIILGKIFKVPQGISYESQGHTRPTTSQTRANSKPKSGKSNLKSLDLDPIQEGIYHLMNQEKIYKDSELSAQALANQLGITKHQLSEFLNEHLGVSYHDFLGNYRVAEAKRLLLTKSDWDVLRIGLESGFNSKATFYRAFKDREGMSPQEFRKGSLENS